MKAAFPSLLVSLSLAVACTPAAAPVITPPVAQGGSGSAGAPTNTAGTGGIPSVGGSPMGGSAGASGAGPDLDLGSVGPSVVQNLALGDDFNAASNIALDRLSALYDSKLGQWTTGPRWSWANDVEASLANYERSNGLLTPLLFVETFDLNRAKNFLDDLGYDDEAWWANVWIRAFDASGDGKYLDMAKLIFADMATAWDPSTCNGGVWWNRNRDYKNAITNELFLFTAASLHNRTPGDTAFLDWATRSWDWFEKSGMINASNLVDDGQTQDCKGNGQTAWTYNQGVILGALVELYTATSDAKYLTEAQKLADASTAKLVTAGGILQEPCEVQNNCNDDQSNFKGVFQRHLLRLYDATQNAAYGAFLFRNAHSLWTQARNTDGSLGNHWAGPFDSSDAQRQNSGLQALHAVAPPLTRGVPFLRAAGGASFNHAQGRPVPPLAWRCDPASCPSTGVMQSGPFVAYLPGGAHTAHFQLAASTLNPAGGQLAHIDVFDETDTTLLSTTSVPWSAFRVARIAQDFPVEFRSIAGHAVGFRVIWDALPDAHALTISDVAIDQPSAFSAANLSHACGRLDAFENWTVDRQHDAASCALSSGANVTPAAGHNTAHFELRVDNFNLDDAPVATLTVVDQVSGATLVTRALTRKDFPNALFQDFSLEFSSETAHSYDLTTTWQRSDSAPRLTERGVYVLANTRDVTLGLPFDTRGIGTTANDGSIDDVGSTFPAQWLGAGTSFGGHSFLFGSTTPNALNVLSANGQTLTLPAKAARSLSLLLLGINGTQSGTVVVHYADGTSTSAAIAVSDWASPATELGESYAVAAPHRWTKTGIEYLNFHLFHEAVTLDPARVAVSVSLPVNLKLKLFAATLSTVE